MFEIYHKITKKVESSGETRYKAWKVFFEDVNTFADNIEEFQMVMGCRGYSSRKVKEQKGVSMEIVVYGTGKECAWCVRCCEYLEQSGKEYTYKNVREDDAALEELKTQGFGSVPQVFIDGEHIGGYMELRKVSL